MLIVGMMTMSTTTMTIAAVAVAVGVVDVSCEREFGGCFVFIGILLLYFMRVLNWLHCVGND
jgi:hypothetical protein